MGASWKKANRGFPEFSDMVWRQCVQKNQACLGNAAPINVLVAERVIVRLIRAFTMQRKIGREGEGRKRKWGRGREGTDLPVFNSAFPNAKTYSTMELFPKSLKTVSQETHFPNIEMKARHEMSIRKRDRTK